jgi:CobQ-like glutamine amidotransferase family enzyme
VRRKVVLAHLFPDYLNIYADRGNMAVLERRAAWRGIEFDYRTIGLGEPVRAGEHDLLYVGGGQDREQALVAPDLAAKGEGLAEAVAAGAALLAVCGGYQLLGRFYRDRSGAELPGVGLFPLHTSSPASGTTARTASRAASSGARSARTCTARFFPETPGLQIGCSGKRSRTASASRPTSMPSPTTSSSRRTT